MKANILRLLHLAMVATTILSLAGCGDYSLDLPGKFDLVRVYASAVLITGPDGRIVINANIDQYAVIDDVIVGHVALAEFSPERENSVPGYFVLNTKTHALTQGLDKETWLTTLQREEIDTEPVLDVPSRFDRTYGPSEQQGVRRVLSVLGDTFRICVVLIRDIFR